ncbi:MAG: hypothetical protein ABSA16_06075 [Thermoguttaceae bacterium]|jgi:hypothetical protein
MIVKVAHITAKELQKMIGAAVEEKLLKLLGDPDRGLEIKRSLRNRLLQQKKRVAFGQRGEKLQAVAKRLDKH